MLRVFRISYFSFFAFGLLASSLFGSDLKKPSNLQRARQSVVRIQVSFFQYSYKDPWKQPSILRASGTGFIIEENRILTNAHVVAGANTIRVSLPGHRTDYEAKVKYIAHDCDLAILEVEDAVFFKGSDFLELGASPELNTPVEVIGYPIGGERVSITRGIVSRKGMDVYSHSRVDYHMTVQVDAAINPGNSGGPALQGGHVIGVAFQSLKRGENLGYLIPPEVVRKFLRDIKDGTYDGYTELGVLHTPTTNPVMRRAMGLEGNIDSPDTGVHIYGIIPGAAAAGHLELNDILLSINGKQISENGDVEIDGHLQPFALVVDNFEAGEMIKVEVWRNGVRKNLQFPARKTSVFDSQRKNYDTAPNFLTLGGMVFQPLDANLMETYHTRWTNNADLVYRYKFFISGQVYREVDESVVLTRRIGDRINVHHGRYENKIVQSVNGHAVRNFKGFLNAIDEQLRKERIVIHFRNEDVPLVLESSLVHKADKRIQKRFGLPILRQIATKRTRTRP